MNNIKFSVIVPLYNKEKHILRTIESITNQSYPAAEILIIDDGSSDGGAALVEAANIDNVRVIHQKNQGVSGARNNGVSFASHPYIAFLDADDQWLPLFLEEIAHLINKFPQAGFFGTRYQIVEEGENFCDAKINLKCLNPEGVILDDYFDIASSGDLPFTMSSMVIEKSLFNFVGGFPLNEPIGEDQELFCNVALSGKIAYSPNIHSLYHKDAENQASKINVPNEECGFSKRVTLSANKQTDKIKAKQMLKYSAAHLCHIAKLNIIKGQFQQARSLLNDKRCQLKPKHLIYLLGLSFTSELKYKIVKVYKSKISGEFSV